MVSGTATLHWVVYILIKILNRVMGIYSSSYLFFLLKIFELEF